MIKPNPESQPVNSKEIDLLYEFLQVIRLYVQKHSNVLLYLFNDNNYKLEWLSMCSCILIYSFGLLNEMPLAIYHATVMEVIH